MNKIQSYPWRLSERDFQDLLRSLVFRYHKWDLTVNQRCRILPESIVLSRATHDYLVRVSESFCAAIRRFESCVRKEPHVLTDLGIEPILHPLIATQGSRESAFCRVDFFLTPDGDWRISEFNEDVPGGFNESFGIGELINETTLGGQVTGALKNQLVEAFYDCERIGLIFATAYSEDLQHCALLAEWLEEAGHETVLASPEQMEWKRGPRLGALPVNGLFRFFPGESMALLPNLDTWARVLPRLRQINPLVRMLAQSKRCFGLWQGTSPLSPEDQWLCDAFLPRTKLYDTSLEGEARNSRERWVLKRAFGRMGDAVHVGALIKKEEWETALVVARSRPGEFALQECFQVAPLPFESGELYPTIGAYTVNGRFAGYYSRVAPQPFITCEAYHVATVVETADCPG